MGSTTSEIAAPSQATEVTVKRLEEVATKSQTLAVRIHRGILRLAPGRIHGLKVIVGDDTIQLQGGCASYYCKQVAQTAAMALAHGQQVDNHIEVA